MPLQPGWISRPLCWVTEAELNTPGTTWLCLCRVLLWGCVSAHQTVWMLVTPSWGLQASTGLALWCPSLRELCGRRRGRSGQTGAVGPPAPSFQGTPGIQWPPLNLSWPWSVTQLCPVTYTNSHCQEKGRATFHQRVPIYLPLLFLIWTQSPGVGCRPRPVHHVLLRSMQGARRQQGSFESPSRWCQGPHSQLWD